LTISATATLAAPAAEFSHFVDADTVPRKLTAEGILRTDASLDSGVVAAFSFLNFATASNAATGATIVGAVVTILACSALAVAADRSATFTTAAALRFDFANTDVVPFGFATVDVRLADAICDCWIIATCCVVGCAAVTIAATRTAILGADNAIFIDVARAITTGTTTTAIPGVPRAGSVAIANVVVGPIAWIVRFAA